MTRKIRAFKISDVEIFPIWSDSLGAKSFSVFIKTSDISIFIDAGIAVMHPSFPLDADKIMKYYDDGWMRILEFVKMADIVTITHYHYDHYSPDALDIYKGKIILAKDPNQYINESQRERALEFYSGLSEFLMKKQLEFGQREEIIRIEDPMEKLPMAMSIDYGDYAGRKKELLEKGFKWYEKLVKKWNNWKIIPEIKYEDTEVIFADGKTFKFGNLKIHFQKPMFHGIEFSRVGWVLPIVIEIGDIKILYSSDLNGPIIEDYAEWIINKNPDVLFIDGPATYMIPYTLNLINFRRTLKNLEAIVRSVRSKIIFLDHHLTRDLRFRLRLEPIYSIARENKVKIKTFAEWFNKVPIAEKLFQEKQEKKKNSKHKY
ncbi:MAG: MBL fold metallo-hydrolase [Candidatus Odinarchaeota archaeon]|nr:MBL fold metallo-hydrolase [Candidatus Odinarchaeota archaeon]